MIPVHVQTGDDRYIGVDKAILKKADVMPQGLINTREKIGERGEALLGFARWVAKRVRRFGEEGYAPSIHFDTYGMIGKAFDDDLEKGTKYIMRLEDAVNPLDLQIEMPIDVGEMKEQISVFSKLKDMLKESGSRVMIVADEWANNLLEIKTWADSKAADIVHIKPTDVGSIDSLIRAVLYCKERGIGAYLGGSCNETDKAAQVCAHVALATRPFQMSVKPGMAIDEGLSIIHNEMKRTLAIIASRTP
jgi:methylaspartate ammonia-lyase